MGQQLEHRFAHSTVFFSSKKKVSFLQRIFSRQDGSRLQFEILGCRELLALWGVSRELRALASENHAWADVLRLLLSDFPLGEDELARPAYTARARGERHDHNSIHPCEADRGELAGLVLLHVSTHNKI